MSEANTAPTEAAAAPTPVGDPTTSLTAGGAAPASSDQGGGDTQSSATGEGEAAQAAGQGASAEQAGEAGASAEGDAAQGSESGDAQGAPEAYAAFDLPEGYVLEGEMLDGITALAKAHKMTQEQAQAVVDLGVKQGKAIFDSVASEASKNPVLLAAHWANTWSKQTAADPELGGQNLGDTLSTARQAMVKFGSPELAKFLNDTGLAHHPELVRLMHRVGQAVGEDTLVTSQGGQGKEPADTAKRLYPNMT